MEIEQLDNETEIDRESGSLIVRECYAVQRPGKSRHVVKIEVSESGTPQDETCDCSGFQYRGTCAHIDAVMSECEHEVHWA